VGYSIVGGKPGRFWEEIAFSNIMKYLTSSLLVGHIFGIEIRFHVSMLLSVVIAYFIFRPTDPGRALLALLWLTGFAICILLHELGHASAAKLVGVEVKSIVIWLLGGFTNLKYQPEKPVHRLVIYAAGPLVTLFLGFLFGGSFLISNIFLPSRVPFLWTQTLLIFFLSLAVLNMSLFVFNILPVYPLDGGNILHGLTELLFGKTNANLITMIVSIPVLLGLIVFGIYTRDFILLIFCVLIFIAVSTLNQQTQHWMNLGLSYLFKRAAYYYLQRDFDRAVIYFTRDIERQPQQINHYLGRAYSYLLMLQKEKALADVERALTIDPNSAAALQLRGDLYAMEKHYDAAMELFERAGQQNPTWANPYFGRGSILLEKKEFESALQHLDKAISFFAQYSLFYVIRSMAYFRLGNLRAAHKDQDLALGLSKRDALVMIDINMNVYERYLDWAEDYYGRVLLKQPRLGYAYQGLADACRINGEHDKAIVNYTSALKLNPREPRLYLGRGKSYRAKSNINCATLDFQQAASLTDKPYLRHQAKDLLKSLQEKNSK
jgi:tetratricopeptide (TPR) repeat protein/Zn-dependent protease